MTKPHSPSEWWTGDPQLLPLASEVPLFEVVLKPNFLAPDACRALVQCFERNRSRAARTGNPYWDGRFIWSSSLPADKELPALRILQRVRNAARTSVILHFNTARQLYSDTSQLVHWPTGIELKPHADNVEPSLQPNSTPHRAFSSVLYLNDDYEGGETYFPFLGFRVQPKTGTFLAFRSGATHAHGVTKVTAGDRYTWAGWFTHDTMREDPQARIIY